MVEDLEFKNVDDQLLRMKNLLPQFSEAEIRAALNFTNFMNFVVVE